MRLLALETATWLASVAVTEGDQVLAQRRQRTEGQHTVHLIPMIDAALAEAKCSVADLDAVAVSVGPGSFTGLRVGVGLAKGLAYARRLPLIPVPTLRALASAAPVQRGAVAAVLDARRGELYAALFARQGERCTPLGHERLLAPKALLEWLPSPVTVIGDAVQRYGEWLASQAKQVVVLPFPEYGPDAVAVAQVARQVGCSQPVEQVEPRYVRPSEAEEKRAKLLKNHAETGAAAV